MDVKLFFTEKYILTSATFWYNFWSRGNNPNPNPQPWPFEPEISRLQHSVKDYRYYCAKFQVIAIIGFHFIVLTYPPTHTHSHTHTPRQIHCNIGATAVPYVAELRMLSMTHDITSYYAWLLTKFQQLLGIATWNFVSFIHKHRETNERTESEAVESPWDVPW